MEFLSRPVLFFIYFCGEGHNKGLVLYCVFILVAVEYADLSAAEEGWGVRRRGGGAG